MSVNTSEKSLKTKDSDGTKSIKKPEIYRAFTVFIFINAIFMKLSSCIGNGLGGEGVLHFWVMQFLRAKTDVEIRNAD